MADEKKRLNIADLEAQVTELSEQVSNFKLAASDSGFSQGDCTNGCTFTCTGGCTSTCVFEPAVIEAQS
ncbi:MAG: hypothetical protein L0H64_04210 [Pseudonocardia sp.]|nr:hypothetical protein [Pseudonocardia sp.]